MPPTNEKTSNALTLLRRAGAPPIMSLVKVGVGADMSAALTRMILRNIHLAFMSRPKEIIELNSTENSFAPEQREGEAPVLKWVRVAVKPPTGPPEGPQSRWDESVNWDLAGSSKKFKGIGAKSNKPKFILTEVAYDDWRKHYAKDKTGKYRGTEAPAENCILLPEDEIKWRSEPPASEAAQSDPAEEELPPPIKPIQRSATMPEFQGFDPVLSTQSEEASAVPTQKEEAIFIEADGHMASKIVEVTSPESSTVPTSPTLPTSPSQPISSDPPTSPPSKKSWKDRIEKRTRFSMLGRSSTMGM